jgi:hypothetical protein
MKHFRHLLTALLMLCTTAVLAHDFEVDGIYYNITSETDLTVEVTHQGDSYNSFEEYTDTVIIPETVTYDGRIYRVVSIGRHAFDESWNLIKVVIPNSVTNIEYSAFGYCTKLTTLILGNSIVSIGDYAFCDCYDLLNITIPGSVNSIGERAFRYCDNLKYINSLIPANKLFSISEDCFYGANANCILYVPVGATKTYSGKVGWNKFTISEMYKSPKSVVINMWDNSFNGWENNSITIKENGVETRFAQVQGGEKQTYEFNYDSQINYQLFWNKGNTPKDCCFEIIIDGELAYSASPTTCSKFTDKQQFFQFGYIPNDDEGGDTQELITISMTDSYGDGWNGNTINIKKDGIQIGTATISSSYRHHQTVTFEYDSSSEYTFYWNRGSYSSECSFSILIGENIIYSATSTNCSGFTTGQLIYKILINPLPLLIEKINIMDGEWYMYGNENTTFNVNNLTYSRTLPNTEWNALYLPFKVPVEMLTDNYDVAYFNNMHAYDRDNNGQIDEMDMEIMLLTEGTLHANHPYFIRAKNDAAKKLNIELTDATLYTTQENSLTCSSVYLNYELKGIYTQRTAAELTDCYAINTSGAWSPIATGSYLNPFRLYLKITSRDGSPVEVAPSALHSIRIRLKGDYTTDIDEVETQTTDATIIYDLSGRRVENPGKGVYIVNGKKVVLK